MATSIQHAFQDFLRNDSPTVDYCCDLEADDILCLSGSRSQEAPEKRLPKKNSMVAGGNTVKGIMVLLTYFLKI